jgi:hypothetical protein
MSPMASLRLTLARACAWGLLVAGWVGLGSFALRLAPSLALGFALVALWLLALGATATVATRGDLRPWSRVSALAVAAGLTSAGVLATVRGGGLAALLLALFGWAALTALASGVVRSLRLAQAAPPAPPIAAAALGALVAGVVLGDIGDLPALAQRLAALVAAAALALALLQRGIDAAARAPGCRAGLFDCSLPAWPPGAWRDLRQWPTLLAGLAMLPMMAALPLMVAWCRANAIEPQATVLLHLAAMFGPALVLRHSSARWPPFALSAACAALLATGAALVAWAPAPLDWLGLAFAHGAAWSIAWSGALWAPQRRARRGSSPLRAAIGYALLTMVFGIVAERLGAFGIAAAHVALALAAVAALALAVSRALLARAYRINGLRPRRTP